jgi:kinesin family member 1
MQGAQTVLHPPPDAEERLRKGAKGGLDGQRTFAFDKSYWSFNRADSHFAGQDSLFNDLGAPLLDNAFQGYNNCIFAYGQTGSGKSYSMMGYGQETGVIPRICRDMFDRIIDLQSDKNLHCTVEVSYLEIYNERVRDLLNPSTKGNLKVREHPSTGPYVEDLAKLVVRSFPEIENLMDEGNKARTVAATNMNETSSRSHAVFTLTLTQKRHDVETSMDTEKVAKISLVDLAGSERAASTGATGSRLKEGAEINRSLSTLGRVIAALADLSTGKKRNMSMVPYRDSVLTWLLKDSLGGNSMTAMIAAISPADINFEETLSTLRYADSAKRIKNHAIVNEDPNARMIRELKEELAQLRSKLGGSAGPVGTAEESYPPDTPLDKQFVSITQADGTVKKVSKAEITEQLNQSEKLYKDLNQTWEEKLQTTEKIQKEREAALEELGISIEKGFVGLSTPKKMPHLVNLSDDPLLAECLIYNIKPGITTVGHLDTATNSEIRLNGSKILHHHCTFENTDNVVTVIPNEGAAVMVNGMRISEPKRLRSGYRIILGDFHIFRFNHPQEARAERAEQSLLRHSITASQLGSPRPGHERSMSKAGSEIDGDSSRAESPMPSQRGRDSDWSFARREAAGAMLGSDQKIANLTDDELDMLFDDVQRARAVRRGRPESRLFDTEEDLDSLSSFAIRDKYMSNGTIDNFSIDTAITIPGTPQRNESEEDVDRDGLQTVRDDMQRQLDKQKEDYLEKLKTAEASSSHTMEELRVEKANMEEALKAAKEEFQQELRRQKEAFESQIQKLAKPKSPKVTQDGFARLDNNEISVAKSVFDHWQRRNFVRMAESVLQNAALLKEAQVMSQVMDKDVSFQFCIVDVGHTMASSYDLVLNGVSGDDDSALEDAKKPCVGVRVIDFRRSVIYVWSLEKLRNRVSVMRQMHQYLDRPEYLQHFRLENPFLESCEPQYSLIGDADIPLTAVFESRVQDFSAEVVSPYTQSVIGIIKLSLEPSSAHAPASMLKFNVVLHNFSGFPEREGTSVHAQLFVPGLSEDGGATTTQMITGFDENPVRFESVHSMSLPQSGPRTSSLKISIFAKITPEHCDMLLSWDNLRDGAEEPPRRKRTRLAEAEFYSEERHDVFARIQMLELAETGEYLPVDVLQTSSLDPGTYQLHQGLQRRVVVNLTHSSGENLQWEDLNSLRVGAVRLIDPMGTVPDLDPPSPDIPLKLIQEPMVNDNADGTSNVTIEGQWDSSVHNSLLLDRTTSDRYKTQISLRWNVISPRLESPMVFTITQNLQILPRSYIRPKSLFKQLFSPTVRAVHSTTGTFSIAIRPLSAKRASDLWRMDTQNDYVKGEELLTTWCPRRISLIKDFLNARKRRRRIAEIDAAKGALGARTLSTMSRSISGTTTPSTDPLSAHDSQLLQKFLSLWSNTAPDPSEAILKPSNTEPPAAGAAFATSTDTTADTRISRYTANVTLIPKNPTALKSGFLLTPNDTNTHWLRRFVELRPPYLHIHSVPDGDEVNAISLRNARVDREPDFAQLLGGGSVGADGAAGDGLRGKHNVFAIYAERNAWLFAARSEAGKVEWLLGIDRSFFGSGSGSGSGDSE